jgi:hypothetical protein
VVNARVREFFKLPVLAASVVEEAK